MNALLHPQGCQEWRYAVAGLLYLELTSQQAEQLIRPCLTAFRLVMQCHWHPQIALDAVCRKYPNVNHPFIHTYLMRSMVSMSWLSGVVGHFVPTPQ